MSDRGTPIYHVTMVNPDGSGQRTTSREVVQEAHACAREWIERHRDVRTGSTITVTQTDKHFKDALLGTYLKLPRGFSVKYANGKEYLYGTGYPRRNRRRSVS